MENFTAEEIQRLIPFLNLRRRNSRLARAKMTWIHYQILRRRDAFKFVLELLMQGYLKGNPHAYVSCMEHLTTYYALIKKELKGISLPVADYDQVFLETEKVLKNQPKNKKSGQRKVDDFWANFNDRQFPVALVGLIDFELESMGVPEEVRVEIGYLFIALQLFCEKRIQEAGRTFPKLG
ncbi:hypothetical protein [Persicobacter diffluens]|uniref:Uncharacterized protein n=1 Tax=Persicobacter diffluens TaxID=981 RepID=A0AAN4W6I5_9BACT|nr:hypothetical protein PEDI_55370 [Persicobacter diffluens]